MIPIELIDRLRAWIFSRDRDIAMQSGRTITLGDGRIIDNDLDHIIPVGGVIFWPSTAGAIPSNWTTFSTAAGRFLIGTSGSFSNGSTGGASTIDIQHSHNATGNPISDLIAASVNHSHGYGSLSTDADNHTHTNSFGVSSNIHNHGNGTLAIDASGDVTHQIDSGGTTVATDTHTHALSGAIADHNSHKHFISGSSDGDSHSHTLTSGATSSAAHSHAASGSTDTALSSTQPILPPYLVGTWIQRTS